MTVMNNDNNSGQNHLDFNEHPPTLPDFDTLRNMAKNSPENLEKLRLALCERVISEAPEHAKPRLRGLMFQINSRRELARSDLDKAAVVSDMMNESLQRMQAMLKDLRTIQSESILLTSKQGKHTRNQSSSTDTAQILPFRRS